MSEMKNLDNEIGVKIEEKNTFDNALRTGISLFLGAGFSVLAKDMHGANLPCGEDLLEEIKENFPKVSAFNDLNKAATVLKKSIEREKFKQYLTDRFSVGEYGREYDCLTRVNVKSIFTTNIDDLVCKVWENSASTQKYINNTLSVGEANEGLAINYYPLHGCVRNPDKEYIFSNIDISSAYLSLERGWDSLKHTVSGSPVLFWGWRFSDSDIIEAIYSKRSKMVDDNSRKWVVLHNPGEDEVEFYRSLNFSIITGGTKELLEYFSQVNINLDKKPETGLSVPEKYRVPSAAGAISYPVENFFMGDVPRWSYIYSGQIIKTQHYKKISDLIFSGEDVVVTGIPASGKTTLMMQLASGIDAGRPKHIMFSPTVSEVSNYCKIIGSERVLVFVDDCLGDYLAMEQLLSKANIQVVGFERDNKYESIAFKLNDKKLKYKVYDVSEVCDQDIAGIIDSIPKGIYTGRMVGIKDKTLFEIIRMHTRNESIDDRFVTAFRELYGYDPETAELFLMISYVHSCGVPVSYDMIFSYLDGTDYKEVYQRIKNIGKQVVNCYGQDFSFLGEMNLNDQDYYMCRTRHLAETIIQKVPIHALMRQMLNRFVERVPVFKICRYDVFKMSAFDADLVTTYFHKYEEGMSFYDKCLEMDDSAFMYQQMALYASRKKKYSDAFRYIDMAKNCRRSNIFSIRNTHAIILFNANINKEDDDQSVVATLHQSMGILEDCYKNDLRKGYHARIFGEHLLKFYESYGYQEVERYIETAVEWLDNEISSDCNGKSSKKKMRQTKANIENKIIKPNEF